MKNKKVAAMWRAGEENSKLREQVQKSWGGEELDSCKTYQGTEVAAI